MLPAASSSENFPEKFWAKVHNVSSEREDLSRIWDETGISGVFLDELNLQTILFDFGSLIV